MAKKTPNKYDVCILGAGMAGLTLARQLKQRDSSLNVAVIEHRKFPVANATHKVGESTVEIASHYFSEQLGMKEHLEKMQLPKFGLRLYLRGEQAIKSDLSQYDEIGASRVLPIPTFQLDRGQFENHLADQCQADGTNLFDGTTVRDIKLEQNNHTLSLSKHDASSEEKLTCRYLVDASGRRAWLRKKESLSRPARHNNTAIWFRVEGDLNLDSWSTNDEWLNRCHGSPRRLSTTHFTGPGYWLWLIPLSSNCTSIGLVFDPKLVPTELVRKHDLLIKWLHTEHPLVADKIADLPPLDFYILQNYAVSSSQVFSDQGWMATGDAGLFSDPLYSPGADFIAISNSYITELITSNADATRYKEFESYFLSFFTSTISLYRGQYAGLGNRDLVIAKTIWDYAYYWAALSKLYFSGKFIDSEFIAIRTTSAFKSSCFKFFYATKISRRFKISQACWWRRAFL